MKVRHSIASPAIAALLLAACTTIGFAQVPTLPPSSIANAADAGQLFHTNLEVLTSADFSPTPLAYGPPFGGYFYQTPASISCIYQLTAATFGCNPNKVSANPVGGGKALALVDAFDDPVAYSDLQHFSAQFGLAAISPSSFQVVFAPKGGSFPGSCTGAATRPPSALGTGWDVEESLDIEWAHAMAPSATLYLVEAQSNYDSDLFCAITVANNLLHAAGGGEISMSWGSNEFPQETLLDSEFTAPNVVYFASTGDAPGVSYPSVSPNVVAVGGTSLSFSPFNGAFLGENTWQGTGGGLSAFEPRPTYQDSLASIVGSQRGTPDVASDANPYTGVWVWDSLGLPPGKGWYIVGGTSVASPTWAGIVNAAGAFAPSSHSEISKLYGDYLGSAFNGIATGTCGPYMGYFATGSWDFCSGRGSPKTYSGK